LGSWFFSMLDLSIIIVAYNSPDLLQATLESLARHTLGISYELIVVDNSPAPGIALPDHLAAQLQLIRNPQNAGFAAANNLGLRLSQGRYIALLNPDTLLHDDALSALVRWLDAHPDVGAVGPQLLQSDGLPQPYSHGSAPTPGYLIRRILSHLCGGYLHDWAGSQPKPADWVAGTCMIVRRSAFEAVGGLDERFFLYFEDVDWGWRLRRAGWPVVFVPGVTITHIGGGSIGPHARRHYDRSLVRLYAKYYGSLAGFGVWLALRLYRRLQSVTCEGRR
ncbi:MAG TPA: glycosyltransferase family 2 protein, partial [Herpetosiphonaceae bacterium]